MSNSNTILHAIHLPTGIILYPDNPIPGAHIGISKSIRLRYILDRLENYDSLRDIYFAGFTTKYDRNTRIREFTQVLIIDHIDEFEIIYE